MCSDVFYCLVRDYVFLPNLEFNKKNKKINIMKIVQTDFSKELSNLLIKHKKTIQADKGGVYFVDDENLSDVLIIKATLASEDIRDKMILINKL
jgi:hypothetical protein